MLPSYELELPAVMHVVDRHSGNDRRSNERAITVQGRIRACPSGEPPCGCCVQHGVVRMYDHPYVSDAAAIPAVEPSVNQERPDRHTRGSMHNNTEIIHAPRGAKQSRGYSSRGGERITIRANLLGDLDVHVYRWSRGGGQNNGAKQCRR